MNSDKVADEAVELQPLDDGLYSPTELDDYLQFSAEAVGYASREQQFNMYNTIWSHINDPNASVLDFGAGRGDFGRWLCTTFNVLPVDINYTAIDFNDNLVNASTQLDDGISVINKDWFSLPADIRADWCINVNSNNLRYDANTSKNDLEYLQETIKVMVDRANVGAVISLTSDVTNIQDGLINWNPGNIFNWSVQEFKTVALDHTFSEQVFILIIFKN